MHVEKVSSVAISLLFILFFLAVRSLLWATTRSPTAYHQTPLVFSPAPTHPPTHACFPVSRKK